MKWIKNWQKILNWTSLEIGKQTIYETSPLLDMIFQLSNWTSLKFNYKYICYHRSQRWTHGNSVNLHLNLVAKWEVYNLKSSILVNNLKKVVFYKYFCLIFTNNDSASCYPFTIKSFQLFYFIYIWNNSVRVPLQKITLRAYFKCQAFLEKK